jgi:hypothetical protein
MIKLDAGMEFNHKIDDNGDIEISSNKLDNTL